MKRIHPALIVIAGVAVITAGVAFVKRGEIREAYGRWQRGPVPPPVSRTEAQAGATNAAPGAGANTNVAANVNVAPKPVEPKPTNTNTNTAPAPKPEPAPTPAPKPQPAPSGGIPASYNLDVIFIPQAPRKIWDDFHEETCEESSILMLQAYQNDVHSMSVDDMEHKLELMIQYIKDTWGGDVWRSMELAKVQAVMRDHLGIKTAVVLPVNSLDDVRKQIAMGRPVLLGAAGKMLKNPNFKNGGPLYHALVAKGYTKDTIITNDPGTRLGEDYAYKNDLFFDAIHDWNDGDVYNGAKVMIVIE